MLWAISLLLVLLLAALVYVVANPDKQTDVILGHRRKREPGKKEMARGTAAPRYWATQFRVGNPGSACLAANALQGRIYATDQALPTPLKGCDSKACECQLVPLVERRTESERRAGRERRVVVRLDAMPDRRARPDRRMGTPFALSPAL